MASDPTQALPINRGGQLTPDQVVGRDALLTHIWETLASQSVLLTAERRMGKTSVITKLASQAKAHHFVVAATSVQAVKTPGELVEATIAMVASKLPARSKLTRALAGLVKTAGVKEVDLKVVKLGLTGRAWKAALERVFATLDQHHDEPILLVYDELPYALETIAKNESPAVAREILDVMRSLRASHSGIRMIFCGSIGLHHALAELRDPTVAWQPVNDMALVTVPSLARADAIELARRLLAGTIVVCDDRDAVAARMADAVEAIPFYIHHVAQGLVDRSRDNDDVMTAATVDEIVDRAVLDPEDPWQLGHYVTRLQPYFGDDAEMAGALLDAISLSSGAIGFKELVSGLRGQMPEVTDAKVRSMLDLLERDHYLMKTGGGRVVFRLKLVRRAWIVHRYLES
jgi:hypothetical protein